MGNTQKEHKHLSITDMSEEDRPREKMLAKGAEALSKAELLGILLGSGNTKQTAVELAGDILDDSDGNLVELGKRTIKELMAYNGVGEAKAITVAAALELGRRRNLEVALEKPQVRGSADIFAIFHPMLADKHTEEFWLLMLNRANRVIGMEQLSNGGVSGTLVDIKLALKKSIDRLADAVVFCHNHPLETLSPSREDDNVTHRLRKAFEAVEIRVLDHVIVAGGKYYSYSDHDRLH